MVFLDTLLLVLLSTYIEKIATFNQFTKSYKSGVVTMQLLIYITTIDKYVYISICFYTLSKGTFVTELNWVKSGNYYETEY